jgi:hypothetical protein
MFTEINKNFVLPPCILQKVHFLKPAMLQAIRVFWNHRTFGVEELDHALVRTRVSQDTRYLADNKGNISKLSWRLNSRSWCSANMTVRVYLSLVVEFPQKNLLLPCSEDKASSETSTTIHIKKYGFSTIAHLPYKNIA